MKGCPTLKEDCSFAGLNRLRSLDLNQNGLTERPANLREDTTALQMRLWYNHLIRSTRSLSPRRTSVRKHFPLITQRALLQRYLNGVDGALADVTGEAADPERGVD